MTPAGCAAPPLVGELTCDGHRTAPPNRRTLMQAIEAYVEAQAAYAVAGHAQAHHGDEDFGRERREVDRVRAALEAELVARGLA